MIQSWRGCFINDTLVSLVNRTSCVKSIYCPEERHRGVSSRTRCCHSVCWKPFLNVHDFCFFINTTFTSLIVYFVIVTPLIFCFLIISHWHIGNMFSAAQRRKFHCSIFHMHFFALYSPHTAVRVCVTALRFPVCMLTLRVPCICHIAHIPSKACM